jgi:hypothetical protein
VQEGRQDTPRSYVSRLYSHLEMFGPSVAETGFISNAPYRVQLGGGARTSGERHCIGGHELHADEVTKITTAVLADFNPASVPAWLSKLVLIRTTLGVHGQELVIKGRLGLVERGVGFRVLTGHGSSIDTTTASGKLIFGIFAALAEFERELISERTRAGLASARTRGRKGGREFKMTATKVRMAQAGLANRDTKVGELCKELGITRQTLYRFVAPNGELRADGLRLLGQK